ISAGKTAALPPQSHAPSTFVPPLSSPRVAAALPPASPPPTYPANRPPSRQSLCARSLPHTASWPLPVLARSPFPRRIAASEPQFHTTSESSAPPPCRVPVPEAPPPPLFANTLAAHQSRCKRSMPARQSAAPPDHSPRSSWPTLFAPPARSATSGNGNPFRAIRTSRVGKQYLSRRRSPFHSTAQ